MARARRANGSPRSRSRQARSSSPARQWLAAFSVPPHVARSLIGLALIVVGIITLIALLFPQAGLFNRYLDDILRPAVGQGAWLLGLLLVVGGVLVERPSRMANGSTLALAGGVLMFVAGLGLIHLVWGNGNAAHALSAGGGAVGNALSTTFTGLLSAPGAFVLLMGLVLAGVILLFNVSLRTLLTPVGAGGRAVAGVMARPVRHMADEAVARRQRSSGGQPGAPAGAPDGTARAVDKRPLPASGRRHRRPSRPSCRSARRCGRVAIEGASRPRDEAPSRPTPASARRVPGNCPATSCSMRATRPASGGRLDHARNIRIIEEKLASFQIPAEVIATNTGPVVTQYEVRPDAHVKLSRIEGLADDLAMALAARSIRIEAPIPGRDVVGVEIPNHSI